MTQHIISTLQMMSWIVYKLFREKMEHGDKFVLG